VDYDEIILRWMDHYVRGIDNGVDREKPVHIFVMGDNKWRDEDAWPLRGARPKAFYLSGRYIGKHAYALFEGATRLEAPTSEFTSDPDHPLTDPHREFGARNYQKLAGRNDALVFDSFPFDKDMEVTGPIQATIYASADVADFDLWVRVLDVWPDGRAFNLMSPGLDVLRASYRNASQKPELLAPENVYELKLDGLLTSNVFKTGHQLRIQISGAFSPHFSRNLQTGESEIMSSKTKIGHIRIYHEKDHLSTVTVPIVPR